MIQPVIDELRGQILSGQLSAGTRLTQRELAETFGVSRVPVRDALRLLQAEGLVAPAGSGAVVAPMSIDDLEELYLLRGALEPLACRLGVPNMGTANILVMQQCLERMHEEEGQSWFDAHIEFHRELYRQCGRRRLIELVEKHRIQAQRYLRLHFSDPSSTAHIDEEHKALLKAVMAGDANGVEGVVTVHLQESHRRIASILVARQSSSKV